MGTIRKRVPKRRQSFNMPHYIEQYLLYGKISGIEWYLTRPKGQSDLDYWKINRDTILEIWIDKYPGTRPFAYYKFDCKKKRKRNESELDFLKRCGLLTPEEKRLLTDSRYNKPDNKKERYTS